MPIMSSSPAALVQIDNVTKSFGEKVALKDVSFSVPSGQLCGLLGPNGAGMTDLPCASKSQLQHTGPAVASKSVSGVGSGLGPRPRW